LQVRVLPGEPFVRRPSAATPAAFAVPGEQIGDALDSEGTVGKDELSDRGEVLLLGVDDEERGLVHSGALFAQRVRAAGWPPT
jgi:hypothetical protein